MLTAAWRGKRGYRKGINDQVNEGSSPRSGATTRLTPQQMISGFVSRDGIVIRSWPSLLIMIYS